MDALFANLTRVLRDDIAAPFAVVVIVLIGLIAIAGTLSANESPLRKLVQKLGGVMIGIVVIAIAAVIVTVAMDFGTTVGGN